MPQPSNEQIDALRLIIIEQDALWGCHDERKTAFEWISVLMLLGGKVAAAYFQDARFSSGVRRERLRNLAAFCLNMLVYLEEDLNDKNLD